MLEKVEDLVGKVLADVVPTKPTGVIGEKIIFTLVGGESYQLYHEQD